MQPFLIRLFDIAFATAGILLFSPIILTLLLIGYCCGASPLFFQRRVGRYQQPFTLIKFRTMRTDTRSVGTHLVDSAAVTTLGGVLRRTKLDELPQLVNVLLGQMSLVGPRPCLENQQELIAEREARGVFSLRPGVTGLAQVKSIDMSTPRKLARYDRLLVKNFDFWLYLALICATLFGKGLGDRVMK